MIKSFRNEQTIKTEIAASSIDRFDVSDGAAALFRGLIKLHPTKFTFFFFLGFSLSRPRTVFQKFISDKLMFFHAFLFRFSTKNYLFFEDFSPDYALVSSEWQDYHAVDLICAFKQRPKLFLRSFSGHVRAHLTRSLTFQESFPGFRGVKATVSLIFLTEHFDESLVAPTI